MKIVDWLKPGLQIKRWIVIGFIGILCLSFSISYFIAISGVYINSSLQLILALIGLVFIYISLHYGLRSLLKDISTINGYLNRTKINKKIYDKKILSKGPKVVVIGGGTGLAVLLRGLKLFTANITAIVTVADDGGGSGIIREDLGMLPPGDIRNCILALAEMEPTMEELLQYRFEDGSLKGQSFGNLFIASMNGISNNFEEAIKKIGEVLAVTGKVYPVTLEDITLYALLENGKVIKGESSIPDKVLEENSPIDKVFIRPKEAKGLKEAIEAIEAADIVVLGPGSLYTSVLPNLLVKDISETLIKSENKKVYITNMMTQPGETDDYSIHHHLEGIIKHCPKLKIDYIIANNGEIIDAAEDKYKMEGASLITATKKDRQILQEKNIKLIEDDLVDIKIGYVRHDAIKLSKLIVDLVGNEKNNFKE
ncbi:MAG: YvcK family protein [Clostridiaceae bacterium]|nr:YvcK family protein [Clostridiaceae bacterium]